MDMRKLIIEWVRNNDTSGGMWMLGVLHHLTASGVSMEDAVAAMARFVDDAIRIKRERRDVTEA